LRFRGSLDRFYSKKPLRCSHFSRNSLRKLTGKIFRRTGNFLQVSGNSGSRITSELNQRKYCEACGIPLNAFGNWRAKFKAEPQSPARKVLYRRGSISHALRRLVMTCRGRAPSSHPRARSSSEVQRSRQTADTSEAMRPDSRFSEVARRHRIAERVLFRWKQEITPAAAPLFATVEITSGFSG